MKKRFFALTALVLVTVMLLALAACGSGGSGDALKGSWSGTDENGAVTWTFDGSGKCEMKTDALDSKGTYTIDGWVLGLAYVSTNRDIRGWTDPSKNISNGTALLSVSKSF